MSEKLKSVESRTLPAINPADIGACAANLCASCPMIVLCNKPPAVESRVEASLSDSYEAGAEMPYKQQFSDNSINTVVAHSIADAKKRQAELEVNKALQQKKVVKSRPIAPQKLISKQPQPKKGFFDTLIEMMTGS
ncbi:MAG: hypothetical protein WBB94_01385 [Candidatus Saccharimonadaceae bacterium]